MPQKNLNFALPVLEAVESYCRGTGSLMYLAAMLEVDEVRFCCVIDSEVTDWQEPFSNERPDPQTLLNIVLLEMVRSFRDELIAQKKELRAFKSKLRRLQTPIEV